MSNSEYFVIDNWYVVKKIHTDIYCITEPGHVSFYIIKTKKEAIFVDSGLGLCDKMAEKLIKILGIELFDVICTHAHCDHIGLNYRARYVYIAKNEWNKYIRQNESLQLSLYIKNLKNELRWPNHLNLDEVQSKKWKPTHFINDGDVINFENNQLQIIYSPGHTMGSILVYYTSIKYLFIADFIYTGIMYLHLNDSDYVSFKRSLKNLIRLQKKCPDITLWPSHNHIPLPSDYPQKVLNFTNQFDAGKISKKYDYLSDDIFVEGIGLECDDVKIIVKKHNNKVDVK